MKTWELGPFTRPVDQPVLKPTPELVFDCPMKKKPVHWAENHVFNPATVVKDGKIHMLFRAEDGQGDDIGHYTSRIGLATSEDGIQFDVHPEPVLYPADDEWIADEWYGGCEDPRVVEPEEGTTYVYYTMYNRGNPKGNPRNAILGVASSNDLIHWTKHGTVFTDPEILNSFHKAAGVVQEVRDGRLIAKKIQGKYWMYWGEFAVFLATSDDLIIWTPVRDHQGKLLKLITPRKGKFDAILTEIGPPPVLTEHGIVLLYNGKNGKTDEDRDPALDPGAYSAGQVLFDAQDPTKVLDRTDTPFFKPELDFEKTGQYAAGTVFIEGLVLHKDSWVLHYGTADTYVGVATAPA